MVISRWSFQQVVEDCARAGRDWLLTSCCGLRRRRNPSHLVEATWRFSKVSSTLLQGSQLLLGLKEKLFWLALPKFSASPPAYEKLKHWAALKLFDQLLRSPSWQWWPAAVWGRYPAPCFTGWRCSGAGGNHPAGWCPSAGACCSAGCRMLGAARQLWAKFKNFWHLYFFKISKKIGPQAKEGKLFFNLFFDWMILYGQEGLKKYSLNEISKSALGKNHPTVQFMQFVSECCLAIEYIQYKIMFFPHRNVQSVQFVDIFSVPECCLRGITANQKMLHAVDNKSG